MTINQDSETAQFLEAVAAEIRAGRLSVQGFEHVSDVKAPRGESGSVKFCVTVTSAERSENGH